MSIKSEKKKRPLVPRLRFPEFQEAGEWEGTVVEKLLTESCQLGNKGDKAKKITVKLWGKGVFEKEEAIEGSANTQYYRRRAGQFIYSKLDFLNQAFGIIPNRLDGFESTVDLPCFDFSSDVSPAFLLEYVKREDFYKKYGEIADGGRKAKRIQVETFLSFPVLLPPQHGEQQKIADCLSSFDERITAETNKLDTLKVHKKGLLRQLFPAEGETVPQLRFPEFLGAGKWEESPLSELLLAQPDYGLNAPSVPYSLALPTYIRITDISDDGFFIADKKVSVDILATDQNYLSDGEIVLARTGASVGKAYMYKIDDGKLVFAGFLIRIKPDNQKVNSKFLFYFLFTKRYLKWIEITSPRSGQPGINSDEYATLPTPLPPCHRNDGQLEQQKIADCLSSLDELIAAQSQKLDILKTHKRGLLQQLFPSIDEAKA